MNIILINHYAGSNIHGMEFRPYYLAREWVKMGHSVTIVAASFSHLRQKNPDISELTEEFIDGIRYIWLPVNKYQGNGVMRFKNMLAFIYQLYHNLGKLAQIEPDVVIASSTYPLDSYPAYKLAKMTGAKFAFELHDLWPLSPMELGGMSKWHPFIMLMQRGEDFWCRHADKVISILPKTEAYLKTRGLKDGKFCYIPNGIVLADYDDVLPLKNDYLEQLNNLRKQGKFLVGFAGAHGIANALNVLLYAANKLKNTKAYFVLVGQGQEKENLMALAQKLGLDNILFLASIPKKMVPAFLAQMDALYIGLQNQKLFRFGISPNKLMDYMMAGKPILHSVTAGNDLVQEAHCGISVPAEDVDAVAEAVKKLMLMNKAELSALGANGKEYVTKHHDYKILAEKFIEWVEK